ncbi:HAD family hydrolase [Notoacmeibacter sp. MSK16QG-6]|uniref:HAD family hydrolase n=1 Tax=Notoacmeibacter sp. MSK16QG-6 TaxID=2957982 RepID=UPI00209EDFE0|nr:HAD hydrolase family protein [Notoacmeibacter sp. MSK16QG-6]MCP1200492.1 HAD hydrolase family protein [Notoacmeibacter sp. MSK16QG-6]
MIWALDIDGTLTAPGGNLGPKILSIMRDIPNHIVLITAQAGDYVNRIGGGNYQNLVTEKGMSMRIYGKETRLPAPAEAAGFQAEMQQLLGTLSYRFVFNKKTAGYAVGFENDVPAVQKQQVVDLMDRQARNAKFIVEHTAGFVDITLKSLSKATSLRQVLNTEEYKGMYTVAAGDSANTDGPMLDAADLGIMVKNAYKQYRVVRTPDDMVDILDWFRDVCIADE